MRKIPIGEGAPEGIRVTIRQENCQSKKNRDHLYTCSTWTDKAVKAFRYTTKWYDRSSDILEVTLMGLCDCNLKEKLECSNGIHKGAI